MSTYTYETINGQKTGFFPGYGALKDGKITTDRPLHHPNLRAVGGNSAENNTVTPPAPVVGTASQQNPNQPATADPQPDNKGVNLG